MTDSRKRPNWKERKRQANGTDRDLLASFDRLSETLDDWWSGLTVEEQASAEGEAAVLEKKDASELATMRGDWHKNDDDGCTCSACVCATTIRATDKGIDVRAFVRKMDKRDRLKFIGLRSQGRDLTETEAAVVARLAPDLSVTQVKYVKERVPWLTLRLE